MIRGVKVRCRDLVSASDCQANSFPQVQSPYHHAGRGKVLFLAIIRSVLKKCRVHFHFRPELAKKVPFFCLQLRQGKRRRRDLRT